LPTTAPGRGDDDGAATPGARTRTGQPGGVRPAVWVARGRRPDLPRRAPRDVLAHRAWRAGALLEHRHGTMDGLRPRARLPLESRAGGDQRALRPPRR